MKPLSIEQKAQRYDEAAKVIKSNLDALNEVTETGVKVVNIQSIKNCFYRAFPELKESEDEKTKRILHSISSKMSFHLRDIFTEEEFQCFDAWSNAWLEKQGNQKKQLIDKACNVLVDCIEDFMFRRMETWNEEGKKRTLENIRKKLEE